MLETGWDLAGTSWRLAEPLGLMALALVPLPWIAARRRPRLGWPTLDGFREAPAARAGLLRHLPSMLKSAAIACLAVALARPQTVGGRVRVAGRGVAVEVLVDRSASMTAEDFPSAGKATSRLDAAKATLARFVAGRPDDLIGVATFANIPDRIAPPTLDHAFVLDACRSIRPARAGEGGTNLGHAIAFGLGEVRRATTPRKVVILLTDGRDSPAVSETVRPISPEDAARLARKLGVTLHTVAVGGTGTPAKLGDSSISPIADPGPDRERLAAIADLGGGRSFQADDAGSLEDVFRAIDAIEKSPVVGTIRTRYREGYPSWIVAALILVVLDRISEAGPLRELP